LETKERTIHIINNKYTLSQQVNNPVGEWPQREMRLAFETLKDAVSSQLSLAYLDYSMPIVAQCDALTLGIINPDLSNIS
jgi:hypothetical protein